jgi:hypothetical protein
MLLTFVGIMALVFVVEFRSPGLAGHGVKINVASLLLSFDNYLVVPLISAIPFSVSLSFW